MVHSSFWLWITLFWLFVQHDGWPKLSEGLFVVVSKAVCAYVSIFGPAGNSLHTSLEGVGALHRAVHMYRVALLQ